jgi:uncharacterized membrane protein
MIATDRRERGAVMPIACLSMAAMLVATSFTVDLGRMMERGRTLQLVADIAALDASRVVDTSLPADVQYGVAREAAVMSARRNGLDLTTATLVVHLLGQNGARLANDSTALPAAVEVEVHDRVDFVFQVGSAHATRRAVARPANTDPSAALRLGTGLLSAGGDWSELSSSDLALLNSLFGSLLGGGFSLDAVGYRGLASVDTTLGAVAAAAGFGTDLEGALSASFTLDRFFTTLLDAVASQASDGMTEDAIGALATLRSAASALTGLGTVSLASIVDIDPSVVDDLQALPLPLDRLVRGSIFVARDGSVAKIPGATIGVPGVLTTTAAVGIVEPERTVVGPASSAVESAQVRVRLEITVNVGLVTASVPIVVESASSTATLLAIECDRDTPVGATVGLTTTGARIGLGRLNDSLLVQAGDPAIGTATVTTFSVGVGPLAVAVPITSGDDLDIAALTQDVHFAAAEFGTTKRLGAPLDVGSVVASSLTHATLSGALAALLDPLLATLRTTVAAVVDDAISGLVEPLVESTGAHIGYADVTLDEPDCSTSTPRLIA